MCILHFVLTNEVLYNTDADIVTKCPERGWMFEIGRTGGKDQLTLKIIKWQQMQPICLSWLRTCWEREALNSNLLYSKLITDSNNIALEWSDNTNKIRAIRRSGRRFREKSGGRWNFLDNIYTCGRWIH